MPQNEATESRHAAPFGLKNKIFRVFWSIGWLALGRFTPPPLWAWRRMVLRLFGAKIGNGARLYGSCRIWDPRNLVMHDGALMGRNVNCYNQGLITIGRYAVISWDAVLCSSTHNVEDPGFPLIKRPISIGDHSWVAAEAFVGPGVIVGEGSVLGARAVAMRHLDPWTYYTGNPATAIKARPQPVVADQPKVP